MSTSTSDLDTDDEDSAGPSRRRQIRDGGNGRETEDEMRKRLLVEMEEEHKALERELKELKEKTDEARLAGMSRRLLLAGSHEALIDQSSRKTSDRPFMPHLTFRLL
jgi:dynein intermediate chain